MRIIKSLCDTDLYKITMAQLAFHQFPDATANYRFVCRSKVDLRPYADQIKEAIDDLKNIQFTEDEISYLRSLDLFQEDFLEYLKNLKLDPSQLVFNLGSNLEITTKPVRWAESIFWEIYVLSIVNEVYFKNVSPSTPEAEGYKRLDEKIEMISRSEENLKIIEFGTRRRFSAEWQEKVTTRLKEKLPNNLVGTSNVYLAKKLGLKPIGTLAHELLQAGQALSPDLEHFQNFILRAWYKEYNGKLSITLTDVISTKAFLEDFDSQLAYLYDGVRHDSGDPLKWADQVIQFYKNYGIDPKTKKLIFSDGLNIPKCIEISKHVNKQSQISFGVGTNLTNDLGVPAINIVMKMVGLNGKPVAKISDEPAKAICDSPEFLKELKELFKV